jgi:hypothetical protein
VFAVGPPNAFPNLYVGNGPGLTTALFQNYWVDLEVTPASTYQPGAPDVPARIPHPRFYALLEDAALRQLPGLAASSGVTIQGTASLTGAGALSATVTQGVIVTAAGAGTVTAPAAQGSSASLPGTGALSVTATQGSFAALAAAGVISANSGNTVQGAASLSGAGALSATTVQGTILALAGTAALTATATLGAGAALTGAGTLAPPPPPFQVARSTPSPVTDPRDGTATVTAVATSSPGVS